MVPLFDLTRQYKQIEHELNAAVIAQLASGQYVMGQAHDDFETKAAAALGVKHAVGVANGTDALQIALRGMGLEPGDEVITTPFSFIATAEVVADLNAKPVFVDIDPRTYNLDPAAIAAAVTSRTRAIVPVHLFGHAAPMTEINAIAARHGLAVLEDGAQAWGATYQGKQCGNLGRAGTFSFFPSKNLGACGEGGLISTNDDGVAASARRLRIHGQSERYIHTEIGYNSRLHALQAAILNVKLPYADEWNEKRRRNAALYAQLLDGSPYVLPIELEGCRHVYHQYVIRIPAGINRAKVSGALTAAGVGWAIYYPVPLHLQPVFSDEGYQKGHLPVAELASEQVLALPIFPELREDEVRTVSSALLNAL